MFSLLSLWFLLLYPIIVQNTQTIKSFIIWSFEVVSDVDLLVNDPSLIHINVIPTQPV